jgi:hypothetical protein
MKMKNDIYKKKRLTEANLYAAACF